jgi:hypothetical protein
VADRADSDALREIWSPESLSKYENLWIAFRKGFDIENLQANELLEPLLSTYNSDIQDGNSPIFAFVTFNQVFF